MKKSVMTLLSLALLSGLLGSCARSSTEVWEDTKTCSRYVGKGFRSLFGKHVDNREYANFYEGWEEDPDYVPLAGSEAYQVPGIQDYAASRESPGDPGSSIPGIEGFEYPQGDLLKLFQNIYFETDKYTVQGETNLKYIRQIAQYLTQHPETYIFVEGHADERGAAAYNLALGLRRAHAIRGSLIENGVNPDQLFTISYGKERPLAMGHGEESWQQNRRGQFKLYAR